MTMTVNNHTKKTLETSSPFLTCYMHHSCLLSITQHKEGFHDWFHSNYFQLRCQRDLLKYKFTDYFNFYNYDFAIYPWPNANVEKLSRAAFDKQNLDIIDFIVSMVDLDYYLYFFVDEYYLPIHSNHNQQHFTHDILIHGYDFENETIDVCTFNQEQLFGNYQVSFDSIRTSFVEAHPRADYDKYLYFISSKANSDYKYDIANVKALIDDYLHSRDTSVRNSMHKNPEVQMAFGLDVYDVLLDYCSLFREDKIFYDIRPFHVLWEHKKCMIANIQYIEQQGYLDPENAAEILNRYRIIEQKCQSIRVRFLKYEITKSDKLLTKIEGLLKEVHNEEKEILEHLVQAYK